jgi:hypothetical protein
VNIISIFHEKLKLIIDILIIYKMQGLLRSFIIGSSAFIFVPFYFAVAKNPENNINLNTYAVIAALYFGFMNTLATFIGHKYNLSLF